MHCRRAEVAVKQAVASAESARSLIAEKKTQLEAAAKERSEVLLQVVPMMIVLSSHLCPCADLCARLLLARGNLLCRGA